MLVNNIQYSYLKNGAWNAFSGTSETAMDGIKIQTPKSSPYFLRYRTWNSGKSDWYSRVDSNADDYAGAPNRPIQRLQIQVYGTDGTKITEKIVVLYRARVAGRWLPWVSNAEPEWMQSVHAKYNLGGTIDTNSYYAGNAGQNMDGIEILVYEEGMLGDYTGGEVGASALQYMFGSLDNWQSFDNSFYAEQIDGIKIQTAANKGYYLQYRTKNEGKTDWYPFVKSTGTAYNDYAGYPGKAVQLLEIQAYKNDGTRLRSGVIVMYRVSIEGRWLPWVSNADPEWMRDMQSKHSLGGTLSVNSTYAGNAGQKIDGVEIRIFEDDTENAGSGGSAGTFPGTESGASLQYMTDSLSNWTSFGGTVLADRIDGIKIRTDTDKPYYLSYRSWNAGKSNYYPYVDSRGTAYNDYAGYPGKPIQLLNIYAYANDGTKLREGVVVMYRVHVDNRWLPWVSNANPDWMVSVQEKYDLGGTLDTKSTYAGNKGQNINGVEIHIFEENGTGGGTITPVGKYKIIQNVPFIQQRPKFPTGCESASAVMALKYAGANISLETFVENYLDKKLSGRPFDPNIHFGGNPKGEGKDGNYGCYAPVIKKALDKILLGQRIVAKELKGKSISSLCTEYIDANIPVIFWATRNMTIPYKNGTWRYNGKQIQWISPMHCLLLIGYDKTHYIFNDPLDDSRFTYYSKEAVESAYSGLGQQAVVIYSVDYKRPEQLPPKEGSLSIQQIIPRIKNLEELYQLYYYHKNKIVPSPIDTLNKVLGYLREPDYSDWQWLLTTGGEFIDHDFIKFVKETKPNLYYMMEEFIKTGNRLEVFDTNGGIIDLSHLAATIAGYLDGPFPDFWAGWGGDLATGMQDTTINIEKNKNNPNSPYYGCTNKEIADKTIGKDTLNCNYRDFCSDFDAYKLQKKIKELKNSSETLLLSSALTWYYQAEYQKRFSAIYEELGCSSISLNILEYAIRLKMHTKSVAGLTVADIKGGSPSDEIFMLCCESFAQYIRTMN